MSVPATLRAAAYIVVAMTVAELVYVAGRSELSPGLRICLMFVVLLQVLCAQGAMRFGPGSTLALFAFELITVVAAAGGSGPAAPRVALGASAAAGSGLLAMSL